MLAMATITLLAVGLVPTVFGQIFQPGNSEAQYSKVGTLPLDISRLFNNRGIGMRPNDADFDAYHSSYPAQYMPSSSFVYDGFNYSFPTYKAAGNDNVLAQGQQISIPQGRYFSVQMLAAAETGLAAGFVNATYADNSTSSTQVLVPAWWSWPYPAGGDIIMPFYYDNMTTNYNRSNIFQTINWLDSSKELVSLTLPNVTAGSDSGPGGAKVDTRLHIFSVSLWPVNALTQFSPQLDIQYARSTQKWLEGTNKTQIFEVLVSNIGATAWVLANDTVTVNITSDGVDTVQPGTIKRLRPGDQVIVEVGVVNKANVSSGTSGLATATLTSNTVNVSHAFDATFGIGQYQPTYESIYSHESPSWYNGAKFGIFIHWGVYAVPGWGNSGANESYAEWYWWDLNQGPSYSTETYQYHEKTYGPDVIYDDFIANFTADAWNPQEWVDLFASAGANYFVSVSKHHDGYAIFDLPSNVTYRTSVALPPHRNLLGELFEAAATYQPQLHRATYYSLPEWFHPDYRKYGFSLWPGGNATNPFTNKTLPYTGYVPVNDYITDVIVPEMNALADLGTEILWCDIGGPNMTAEFAASWFNRAASENRQVLLDSRCGLPGDFDTPEYARYGAVQRRKWESNLGMDPYSYGYNRATPTSSYMNASSIVTSLIDIVSKNGNFLLDVGPQANGTIIAIEQENLRQAGTWINTHQESIFNTSFWFVTPEEGDDVRFTTTMGAFYILVMNEVNDTVHLTSPIPWIEGDQVTVVGGNMSGTVVPSRSILAGNQTQYEIDISDEVRNADRWAWVFKIDYSQSNSSTSSTNTTGSSGGASGGTSSTSGSATPTASASASPTPTPTTSASSGSASANGASLMEPASAWTLLAAFLLVGLVV